jgi:hypothetical protein
MDNPNEPPPRSVSDYGMFRDFLDQEEKEHEEKMEDNRSEFDKKTAKYKALYQRFKSMSPEERSVLLKGNPDFGRWLKAYRAKKRAKESYEDNSNKRPKGPPPPPPPPPTGQLGFQSGNNIVFPMMAHKHGGIHGKHHAHRKFM